MHTRGEIFSLKFTKYRLAAGLRSDPLGELKRSRRPPSGNKGAYSSGRGMEGRGGRGEDGKGRGKEEEGKEGGWCPHMTWLVRTTPLFVDNSIREVKWHKSILLRRYKSRYCEIPVLRQNLQHLANSFQLSVWNMTVICPQNKGSSVICLKRYGIR